MRWRSVMLILWPSFLMAAATSAAVFAFVDPLDIIFLGHLKAERELVYASAFFLFWIMGAVSSALTFFMAPKGRVVDEFGDPVDL
ncbi:MAG: hypothetical protein GX049_09515 [Alcaligenaceae bacterium]|nr:hypothetical protein [Alcaligenaceae bacterium]